ncbi:MAG: hypothetical protein Ta2A_12990 [Treponemataceae bacterium]|nr:MAG: hypothetical protein Ta2A_12990 [Treponemataceae bacterium]
MQTAAPCGVAVFLCTHPSQNTHEQGSNSKFEKFTPQKYSTIVLIEIFVVIYIKFLCFNVAVFRYFAGIALL